MNYRRIGKKALKGYVGWKGLKGLTKVAAIDPSPPFVEACRTRFPGVDVQQGTAESLPYDDRSFDVAGSCLVVHFMTDPVAGIGQMARVTREDGWVGATVWARSVMSA